MTNFPRFHWNAGGERFTVVKCPDCELGVSVCDGGNSETLLREFERRHHQRCPNRPTEPCGPPEE